MDNLDLRKFALDAATKLVSVTDGGDAEIVVSNAQKFLDFLEGK